jgi:hypothetical protein
MIRNWYESLVDGIKKMSKCFLLCILISRFVVVSKDNNNVINNK